MTNSVAPPRRIAKTLDSFLVWNDTLGGYTVSHQERLLAHVDADEWVKRKNAGLAESEWRTESLGDGTLLVTDGPKLGQEPASVPPGIYEATWTPDGEALLKPHTLAPDAYVEMNGVLGDIIEEIRWFLTSKDAYSKLGLSWRRGLLIYGPPGNGKTRVIMEAAKQFSDRARVFVMSDINVAKHFRDLVSDLPAICVVEEITEQIEKEGAQDFLNFLDGVEAWPDCITIATTNYPDKLEANIVDRPSRFDQLYLVDNPDPKGRRTYLARFISDEEITDEVLDGTEGMSIAYLKELIVQHKLQGKSFHKVLQDCHARRRLVKKLFKKSENDVGF